MDFRPTASIEHLKQRARLLAAIREFFQAHQYWEVDTPVLCGESVIDRYLEPFAVTGDYGAPRGLATGYLQTSPEFCMKRLLAAGADRIYQIAHVFRQGERGRFHNPEFSMLEWYAVSETDREQRSFTEQLCRNLFSAAGNRLPAVPFLCLSYAEAFIQSLQIDPLAATADELLRICGQLELIDIQDQQGNTQADKDELLNRLLALKVEPWLQQFPAVFLIDYPASQAALAKLSETDPRVASRFELYLYGIEIANGYYELTDPEELRQRNRSENAKRVAAGLAALPEESRLLAAMVSGLPACSGVAVGLDRLIMLAIGCQSIDEVITYPSESA